MTENLPDHPEVIAPPPFLFAGTLGAGLLLQAAFPVRLLPRPVAIGLGTLLIGLSTPFALFAFREMNRAGTNVDLRRPVTALVIEGPYRFTRNPIYLSFTLLFCGIAVLANALWALLLLPFLLIIMQRGVIEREERYLERKFGEDYRQYKTRVRRWL